MGTETPHALVRWCGRHYALAASAVLALAAINLGFRLGSEIVTEWDESLYAITAWEAVEHKRWIGTTFLDHLDYYNSKPPLNVWLIGLAFQVLGPSLISLRITSAVAAWLTVAVLQEWTRRCFGPAVALLAGLVLSTSFGFLYVHSGRSGNPDALFALLILLTVVTLWASHDRPHKRIWLGPIAAGIFLLKGAAVLMPLAIIGLAEWARRRQPRSHGNVGAGLWPRNVGPGLWPRNVGQGLWPRNVGQGLWPRNVGRGLWPRNVGQGLWPRNVGRGLWPRQWPQWRYDVAAGALFLLPVMIWAVARWRIDGWRFFRHMLENDLIGVSLNVLDGHSGGVLFYINVLQKNQYDWLAAGFIAWLLLPRSWSGLRSHMLDNTRGDSLKVLVAIWAAVVLLVPTAMQTKLPWYLNSFYPAFALGVGWIIARALSHQDFGAGRRATVCVVVAAAFCVAEYRLFWYSYHMRDLAGHVQGMLLADGHTVSGRRVFSTRWNNADRFVLMAVRADAEVASGVDDFIAKSESGDYLVALPTDLEHPALFPVRRNAGYVLYQRRD